MTKKIAFVGFGAVDASFIQQLSAVSSVPENNLLFTDNITDAAKFVITKNAEGQIVAIEGAAVYLSAEADDDTVSRARKLKNTGAEVNVDVEPLLSGAVSDESLIAWLNEGEWLASSPAAAPVTTVVEAAPSSPSDDDLASLFADDSVEQAPVPLPEPVSPPPPAVEVPIPVEEVNPFAIQPEPVAVSPVSAPASDFDPFVAPAENESNAPVETSQFESNWQNDEGDQQEVQSAPAAPLQSFLMPSVPSTPVGETPGAERYAGEYSEPAPTYAEPVGNGGFDAQTSPFYPPPAEQEVPAFAPPVDSLPAAPDFAAPDFAAPDQGGFSAPSYDQPQYTEPQYEAPAPQFEAPAPQFEPPQYDAPAPQYAEPAPQYDAPQYAEPVPQFDAPAEPSPNQYYGYEQPAGVPSVAEEPQYDYQQPVEPVYQAPPAPAYQQPAPQPVYQQPAYDPAPQPSAPFVQYPPTVAPSPSQFQRERAIFGEVPAGDTQDFEKRPGGKLVYVTGSHGGAGKTTTSWTLASLVASAMQKSGREDISVWLIESDYRNAKLAQRHNIELGNTSLHLAQMLEWLADQSGAVSDISQRKAEAIRRSTHTLKNGLRIIACPYDTTMRDTKYIQQAVYQAAQYAKMQGGIVFIDADTISSDDIMDSKLAKSADRVVVVSDAGAEHIDDLKRAAKILTAPVLSGGLGVSLANISVLLNKTGADEFRRVEESGVLNPLALGGYLPFIPAWATGWVGSLTGTDEFRNAVVLFARFFNGIVPMKELGHWENYRASKPKSKSGWLDRMFSSKKKKK